MPSDVVSKKVSGGWFDFVDVRTQVARNEFTVLAPNTRVSPKAVASLVLNSTTALAKNVPQRVA